jgi:hypothetical protein
VCFRPAIGLIADTVGSADPKRTEDREPSMLCYPAFLCSLLPALRTCYSHRPFALLESSGLWTPRHY